MSLSPEHEHPHEEPRREALTYLEVSSSGGNKGNPNNSRRDPPPPREVVPHNKLQSGSTTTGSSSSEKINMEETTSSSPTAGAQADHDQQEMMKRNNSPPSRTIIPTTSPGMKIKATATTKTTELIQQQLEPPTSSSCISSRGGGGAPSSGQHLQGNLRSSQWASRSSSSLSRSGSASLLQAIPEMNLIQHQACPNQINTCSTVGVPSLNATTPNYSNTSGDTITTRTPSTTSTSSRPGLTKLPSDTFADVSKDHDRLRAQIQKMSEKQKQAEVSLKMNMLGDYPSNNSLGSVYSDGPGGKKFRLSSGPAGRGKVRNRVFVDAMSQLLCCRNCRRRRPADKNPLSNRI